jgi:lambda repressor-like predicted transcriptional regulator
MNEKTKLVKEKTGMTLKALSKEIGYAETSLTCALRGHYQMGYPLAKILAQKTGMSPLYFLEDDHDNERKD